MKTEKLTAQVVVIGGGGAGLVVALEARRAGAEVLLLNKTSSKGPSCTSLSFGAFRVANTVTSREEHFAQSMVAGKFLNDQKLLKILVEQAFDRVRGLEEYGVPLLLEDPYFYVLGEAPFYGLKMIAALQKAATEWGIMLMSHTLALDLLKVDNTVCGVLAYNTSQDTLLIIYARSVILATGGAGALYPLHDNSPRTTGDGLALAARAGALLRDMEFVQFYPLGLVEGGIFRFIVPPFLADSAPIRNALGENILVKYRIKERPAAVKARDSLSQAMFREISAGRGFGPCLEIDLTGVPEKEWDQNRQLRHYKKILQEKYPGLERPLKIAPVCHHFMGGVTIDETCRTNLPGLFAAGEVTGGLHGANRMGGNALSECVVFGALAGRQATQYAVLAKGFPLETGMIQKAEKQLAHWREKSLDPSQSPQAFKKRLAQIMFTQVGIIRNGEQLEKARKKVESLAEDAQTAMGCQGPRDVMEAIEMINLTTTSRLVIRGALRRTERRGSHYREDYPEINDRRWRIPIINEEHLT
ncbi:MAG: FAD-dependent oxidoreductase [Deltaproteobacteria bacterium]|nr:FAD-dependent oxidoreductase [Deltaproteobacteria bacterium]